MALHSALIMASEPYQGPALTKADLVFGMRSGFISRQVTASQTASLCVHRLWFVPIMVDPKVIFFLL